MLSTITRRSMRPFYMPDFFNDEFFTGMSTRKAAPAVNIKEDDKNYSIEVAIPGIDKKDVKIDMKEDVITISSEMNDGSEEKSDGYKRREFHYSAFDKSFFIPENVNKEEIAAAYKDGVLTVTLPKAEQKEKISRMIEIS